MIDIEALQRENAELRAQVNGVKTPTVKAVEACQWIANAPLGKITHEEFIKQATKLSRAAIAA